MPVSPRRERERAERHQLIITTARELAEHEGWDAVTTRRLAEHIEYSQPVLYSHFSGKDAIIAAVATEGFAELARALEAARTSAKQTRARLAAIVHAYVEFAETNPALYDAMFTLSTELPFAQPDTPAPLQDGFAQLHLVLGPLSGDGDPGLFTELGWSALHGIVTLTRGGRLPRAAQAARLDLLVEHLLARTG
ncbi:TetR/AcrR family transcriptional regulator [Amycolatopsis sp. CA-230715]|uniref:TetR/AcrR family transcriptional regulator n=1 Tax=Amycolatopsis sp. CA-230715 TaxID=2745196 RepID=UPI001C00EDB2|nr:TetR/AcrR family transcriptional regulator [Amycolatopsis sp. CA-230715]QWF84760.1 Nucleoid occlusion factor SlmA [Amycolatopsis sp. CA-230715]